MKKIAVYLALSLCALHAQGASSWELITKQGRTYFVWVQPDAARSDTVFRQAVVALCDYKASPICVVSFWTDRSQVPSIIPITEAQADAKIAQWNANLRTDTRSWKWNCKLPKAIGDADCFGG